MRLASPRPFALAAVACLALGVSGCADVSGKSANAGPAPAKSLPAGLATLARTDVGQYYVTPRSDLSKKELDAAIANLKDQPDVEVAVEKDGRLNVTFRGNPKPDRKAAILKQLVAIGKVDEGI